MQSISTILFISSTLLIFFTRYIVQTVYKKELEYIVYKTLYLFIVIISKGTDLGIYM